jgi:hypothetical protein
LAYVSSNYFGGFVNTKYKTSTVQVYINKSIILFDNNIDTTNIYF